MATFDEGGGGGSPASIVSLEGGGGGGSGAVCGTSSEHCINDNYTCRDDGAGRKHEYAPVCARPSR